MHEIFSQPLFMGLVIAALSHEKSINLNKTRRPMSVHWVACGTCYSTMEGTELGGIELQHSRQFLQVGGH